MTTRSTILIIPVSTLACLFHCTILLSRSLLRRFRLNLDFPPYLAVSTPDFGQLSIPSILPKIMKQPKWTPSAINRGSEIEELELRQPSRFQAVEIPLEKESKYKTIRKFLCRLFKKIPDIEPLGLAEAKQVAQKRTVRQPTKAHPVADRRSRPLSGRYPRLTHTN